MRQGTCLSGSNGLQAYACTQRKPTYAQVLADDRRVALSTVKSHVAYKKPVSGERNADSEVQDQEGSLGRSGTELASGPQGNSARRLAVPHSTATYPEGLVAYRE